MVMNASAMGLAVLLLASGAVPAGAQRIDVLTGEPVRPRQAHPRPEPEIFNAPHAPRQVQTQANNPPIEIYIAPQIGGGSPGGGYAPPSRRY